MARILTFIKHHNTRRYAYMPSKRSRLQSKAQSQTGSENRSLVKFPDTFPWQLGRVGHPTQKAVKFVEKRSKTKQADKSSSGLSPVTIDLSPLRPEVSVWKWWRISFRGFPLFKGKDAAIIFFFCLHCVRRWNETTEAFKLLSHFRKGRICSISTLIEEFRASSPRLNSLTGSERVKEPFHSKVSLIAWWKIRRAVLHNLVSGNKFRWIFSYWILVLKSGNCNQYSLSFFLIARSHYTVVKTSKHSSINLKK